MHINVRYDLVTEVMENISDGICFHFREWRWAWVQWAAGADLTSGIPCHVEVTVQ